MPMTDSETNNNAVKNNSGDNGSNKRNSDVLELPNNELFSGLQSDNVDVIDWINKALQPHLKTSSLSLNSTASNLEELERAGLHLYSELRQLVQTEKENVEEFISESISLLPRTAMEVSTMSEDVHSLESQLQDVSSLLLHPSSFHRRDICNDHSNLVNTNPNLTNLVQVNMEEEQQKTGAEDTNEVPLEEINSVVQEVDYFSSVRDKLEHCSKLLSNVLAVEEGMSTLANSIAIIKKQNNTSEIAVNNTNIVNKVKSTDIDQLAMDVKRVRDYLQVINGEDAAYGAQKYKELEEYEVFILTSLEKEAQVSFAMHQVKRAAYLYTMLRNIGKSNVLLHKYVISVTSPLEHVIETHIANAITTATTYHKSNSSSNNSSSSKLDDNERNINKSSSYSKTNDHEIKNMNRNINKNELRYDNVNQEDNSKWMLIAVQMHLLLPLRTTLCGEFSFLSMLEEVVRSNVMAEREMLHYNTSLPQEENINKQAGRYTGTSKGLDISAAITTITATTTTANVDKILETSSSSSSSSSLSLLESSESSFVKELLFEMIDVIAASFSKHIKPILLAENISFEATNTINNSMITECYRCICNFSLLDTNTECDLFVREEKENMERHGKKREKSEEGEDSIERDAGKFKENCFASNAAQKQVLEACNAKIISDLSRPFHDTEVVEMFCQRANKAVEREISNSCVNVANLHRLTAVLLNGLIECLHYLPRDTIQCCATVWRTTFHSLLAHYKVKREESEEFLVHNYLVIVYVIRTYVNLLHTLMSKALTSTLHDAINEEIVKEVTQCMEEQVWMETDKLIEQYQEKYENAIMATIELPLLTKIADYAHLRFWSNDIHKESNTNNTKNANTTHNVTETMSNAKCSNSAHTIIENDIKSLNVINAQEKERDTVPKPALVMYNIGQISPSSVIRDFGDAIMGIALALDSLRTIMLTEYTSIIASEMYQMRQTHLSLFSSTTATNTTNTISSSAAIVSRLPLSLSDISSMESIQFIHSNVEIEQWLEVVTEKWLDKVVRNVIDNFVEDKVMNITIDFISSSYHQRDTNLSSTATLSQKPVASGISNNNIQNTNTAHESRLAVEQLRTDLSYLLNILRAVSDQPFDNLQSIISKLDVMLIEDNVLEQPLVLRDRLKESEENLEVISKN